MNEMKPEMEEESIGVDMSVELIQQTQLTSKNVFGAAPTLSPKDEGYEIQEYSGNNKQFVDIPNVSRVPYQSRVTSVNGGISDVTCLTKNEIEHSMSINPTISSIDAMDTFTGKFQVSTIANFMEQLQNHVTSQNSTNHVGEPKTLQDRCSAYYLNVAEKVESAISPFMHSPDNPDSGDSNSESVGHLSLGNVPYDPYNQGGYITISNSINSTNPALNSIHEISPHLSQIQMSDFSNNEYVSISEKLDLALPHVSSYDSMSNDMSDFGLNARSVTSLNDLAPDSQDMLSLSTNGDQSLLPICTETDFSSIRSARNLPSENSSDGQNVLSGGQDSNSSYAVSEPDEEREPLSYELQQGFRILREIMAESNKNINWPFINAIDSSQDGCENYYDIVKQPMWLKRMREKFDSREYKSITEYVADMRLMLENCYRYNGPDHAISKKAQRIETMMEQKISLLSRELREKSSIAATSGRPVEETKITGTRRRKVIVPHDSTALLNQLRLEAKEQEKEARRLQILERKQMQEAYHQELASWESTLFNGSLKEQMIRMWELPQIGHFMFLASIPLNIGEVVQWELERCFLLPRESTTMQRIMTTLLSTPYQRTSLDHKPMMPYKVWEDKLRLKLRTWYKMLYDNHRDVPKTCMKLGLEERFFAVLGLRCPMEKRKFHELSYYQRVWIVKGLCDWCLETQESLREAVEIQPITEQRPYDLGNDSEGYTYLHFPQFCGADLRIYKQAPTKMNGRGNEVRARSVSPKKTPLKHRKSVKRKKPPEETTPRSRDSRLRQNPRQSSQTSRGDSDSDGEMSTQRSSVMDTSTDSASDTESQTKDSGISEESDDEDSQASKSQKSVNAEQDVNLNIVIETAPSRLTRSAMRNLTKVFSSNSTPCASRESSPSHRKTPRKRRKFPDSRASTPSIRDGTRSREPSPSSDTEPSNRNVGRRKKSTKISKLTMSNQKQDSSQNSEESERQRDRNMETDSQEQVDTVTERESPISSGLLQSEVTDCQVKGKKLGNSTRAMSVLKGDKEIQGDIRTATCIESSKDNTESHTAEELPKDMVAISGHSSCDVANLSTDIDEKCDKLCTENKESLLQSNADVSQSVNNMDTNCEILDCDDKLCSKKSESSTNKVENEMSRSMNLEDFNRSPTPVAFGDENMTNGKVDIPFELPDDCANKVKLEDEESLASTISAVDPSYHPDSPRYGKPDPEDIPIKSESAIEQKPGVLEELSSPDEKNQMPQDMKEEGEEDFVEIFPEEGVFELVVYDLDSLKKLISDFAGPEENEDVSDAKRPKAVRKRCVIDLHIRLTSLLQELEPWDSKLSSLHKKALVKMKKEQELYVEEPEKEEIEDVWESEESATESENEVEETVEDTTELTKEEKEDEKLGDMDNGVGVTTRGGVKRKRKPPETDSAKKIKSMESTPTITVPPNILQKKSPISAHPTLKAALSGLKLSPQQSANIAFIGNQPVLLTRGQLGGMKNSVIQLNTQGKGSQPQFAFIATSSGSKTPVLLTTQNPALLQQNPANTHMEVITSSQAVVAPQQVLFNGDQKLVLSGNPQFVLNSQGQLNLLASPRSQVAMALPMTTTVTQISSAAGSSTASEANTTKSAIPCFNYSNISQLPTQVIQQLLKTQEQRLMAAGQMTASGSVTSNTASNATAFTKLVQSGLFPAITSPCVLQSRAHNVSENKPPASRSPAVTDTMPTTAAESHSSEANLIQEPLVTVSSSENTSSAMAIDSSQESFNVIPSKPATSNPGTNVAVITDLPVPAGSQDVPTSPHKPKYASNVTVKTLLAQQKISVPVTSVAAPAVSLISTPASKPAKIPIAKQVLTPKPNILSPTIRKNVVQPLKLAKSSPSQVQLLPGGAIGQRIQLVQGGVQPQLVVQKPQNQIASLPGLSGAKVQIVQSADGQLHVVQGAAGGQVVQLVQTPQGQRLQVIKGAQPQVQFIQTSSGQKLQLVQSSKSMVGDVPAVQAVISTEPNATNVQLPQAIVSHCSQLPNTVGATTTKAHTVKQNIPLQLPLHVVKQLSGQTLAVTTVAQPPNQKLILQAPMPQIEQVVSQAQVQFQGGMSVQAVVVPISSPVLKTSTKVAASQSATLVQVKGSGQVIPMTPQLAAKLQVALAKKHAIDEAVKTVITSVTTSLPTANIKVSSPFEMPSRRPHRPVTVTTSAVKAPILSSKPSQVENNNDGLLSSTATDVAIVSSNFTNTTASLASTMIGDILQTQFPVEKSSTVVNVIASRSPSTNNVVSQANFLKSPQKNIGLKLTPQSILTSEGVIQGVVVPGSVLLSEGVLNQLRLISQSQGLAVFQQNKDGHLIQILQSSKQSLAEANHSLVTKSQVQHGLDERLQATSVGTSLNMVGPQAITKGSSHGQSNANLPLTTQLQSSSPQFSTATQPIQMILTSVSSPLVQKQIIPSQSFTSQGVPAGVNILSSQPVKQVPVNSLGAALVLQNSGLVQMAMQKQISQSATNDAVVRSSALPNQGMTGILGPQLVVQAPNVIGLSSQSPVTVAKAGIQAKLIQPTATQLPQQITQQQLLDLVKKQQLQQQAQQRFHTPNILSNQSKSTVPSPSVNLIRGNTPAQPSKLVVFNVNGKLMTAQGVPVNLTQGLVKVGNQVIGAQAGVKTQQAVNVGSLPSTVHQKSAGVNPSAQSWKQTEELSRSAAAGGLQMLAGAASLSSVQMGQGDGDIPSGLQVLANAVNMTEHLP